MSIILCSRRVSHDNICTDNHIQAQVHAPTGTKACLKVHKHKRTDMHKGRHARHKRTDMHKGRRARVHAQNLLTDPTLRKWTQGTRWRTSPDLPQQQPLSPPLPQWQQQQGPTLSPPLKPGWKPQKQRRRSCPSTDKLCISTCRDDGETLPSLLEGQNSFKPSPEMSGGGAFQKPDSRVSRLTILTISQLFSVVDWERKATLCRFDCSTNSMALPAFD